MSTSFYLHFKTRGIKIMSYIILKKVEVKKGVLKYQSFEIKHTLEEAREFISIDPLNYVIEFSDEAIREHYLEIPAFLRKQAG